MAELSGPSVCESEITAKKKKRRRRTGANLKCVAVENISLQTLYDDEQTQLCFMKAENQISDGCVTVTCTI